MTYTIKEVEGENYVEIRFRKYPNKVAILDKIDLPLLQSKNWHINQNYVSLLPGYSNRRLHRIIINAKPGEIVDHINLNKLDNRRCNLRIVTREQNRQNCSGNKPKNPDSKYKGVTREKWAGKWRASINPNKKPINLGNYDTEEAAAEAYNVAAKKYFGEFGYQNKL